MVFNPLAPKPAVATPGSGSMRNSTKQGFDLFLGAGTMKGEAKSSNRLTKAVGIGLPKIVLHVFIAGFALRV